MRGLGRIFQRGPVWWIAYWHRGTEYRESVKSMNRKDAEKLLKKRLGERQGNKFVGPKEERVTFEQLQALLLADYQVNGLRSTSTVKIRLQHLAEFFGGDRAVDIQPDRLAAYQAARRAAGAAAATVNRELAALQRMFSLALKQQLLTHGPVVPDRLEENGPRQGFLEHAEYLAIRRHLDADYQDVLAFGYLSGWRLREITALRWAEVDLDGGMIRLDPARSKTKRTRLLPLSAPLREVMARRLSARRLDTPAVFHHRGRPVGDWRKSWHAACDAAGLPGKLFHDLRRTVARNLIRAGQSEKISMEYTGHATASVFKRYNISTESDLRAAADRLAHYTASLPTESAVVPLPTRAHA